MKNDILRKVATYATGRETLRCLALATVDAPAPAESFNLVDAAKFKEYEVSSVFFSTSRLVATPLLGTWTNRCSYNGAYYEVNSLDQRFLHLGSLRGASVRACYSCGRYW